MDAILYISSLLIIISKFLDCYSTSININNNQLLEQNKLARYFMKKFGVQKAIWYIFIFTILVTVLSLIWVIKVDLLIYDILFIFIALVISAIQLSVAHQNYYRKQNLITKYLMRIYNKG